MSTLSVVSLASFQQDRLGVEPALAIARNPAYGVYRLLWEVQLPLSLNRWLSLHTHPDYGRQPLQFQFVTTPQMALPVANPQPPRFCRTKAAKTLTGTGPAAVASAAASFQPSPVGPGPVFVMPASTPGRPHPVKRCSIKAAASPRRRRRRRRSCVPLPSQQSGGGGTPALIVPGRRPVIGPGRGGGPTHRHHAT